MNAVPRKLVLHVVPKSRAMHCEHQIGLIAPQQARHHAFHWGAPDTLPP
eukprot:CAMPEP_0204081600 /NCGR_PEP_ID=MMETSP0360-20130528/175783_1 /ASSEMBLY_ACC=CAM_ASM_000342 /TAXON_ID=268821 /ORGANISM="Scrippsiella Hangoei, Strain SHTV-5" /LENGTH=48 /DNA_ID= /DNA_START= /DNA_END= /DNA_ORIENTATION=